MSNGMGMAIYLIVWKIKKIATKPDFKIVAGVDKTQFARKDNLGNLKLEFDKLDIDKLGKVRGCLSSLKVKINKSDVDKLVPTYT